VTELLDIFGALLLAAGSFFLFLGSLGLMRMPDVFNRIQAGTKATTLGTLLVLLGGVFIHPDWGLKTVVDRGIPVVYQSFVVTGTGQCSTSQQNPSD